MSAPVVPARRSLLPPLLVAGLLLAAAMVAGLLTGAAEMPVRGVLLALLDGLPFVAVDSGLAPVERSLLLELRLPRVLTAVAVGGLLAVAGAGYQGVFRNPLADPYLLGAAAGAGLAVTLAVVFLPGEAGVAAMPVAAFGGAVGGVLLAYALGRSTGRGGGTATLVLAGVAVMSFLTAVQTFVQQLKVEELERVYAWILGDLGGSWDRLGAIAPSPAVAAVVLLLVLCVGILRGDIFSRRHTVIVTAVGVITLVGAFGVPFFHNMVANGALAWLSDRTYDRGLTQQIDLPVLIAIGFVAGLSSTVFAVGDRLQRDTEGLV